MASGRTHELINLTVLPPIVYYLSPNDLVSFLGGYFVGTFLLSPDNDIYHSKPNKRWKILRFIWIPYTKIFKHRGISHIPIYGIITKMLYLIGIVLIALFILKTLNILKVHNENINLKSILLNPIFLSFTIGLILAEIVHIFTDIIYSTLKPKKKKRKR